MTFRVSFNVRFPRQGHQVWNFDGAIDLREDLALHLGLEASPLFSTI